MQCAFDVNRQCDKSCSAYNIQVNVVSVPMVDEISPLKPTIYVAKLPDNSPYCGRGGFFIGARPTSEQVAMTAIINNHPEIKKLREQCKGEKHEDK